MKKASPSAGLRARSRNETTGKTRGQRHRTVSNKVVIARLIDKHELTQLEAEWLLKAWKVGGVVNSQNRFACYLAGFMAGIALKAVESEVRSRQREKR